MKKFCLEIYAFNELSEEIQEKIILENNKINLAIGNSALEKWLADTTRSVTNDLEQNMSLEFNRDTNNLVGVMYLRENTTKDKDNKYIDEGCFYTTSIDEETKKQQYFKLNDDKKEEETDQEFVKKNFFWFPTIYNVWYEEMKKWCSLSEIKKTLQQKLYLEDGEMVNAYSLADKLNQLLESKSANS